MGVLGILVFFTTKPLNPEACETLKTADSLTVKLLKKHTDWKKRIWWDGSIDVEKTAYPATLYFHLQDTCEEAQKFTAGSQWTISHPRITLQTNWFSQRISIGTTSSSYIVLKKKSPSFVLENILEKVREVIRDIILIDSDLRSSFIAMGLFLGEKHMIPEPIKEKINSIGISHLFAVSGLHVGFIVMIITGVLKRLGISSRFRTGLIPLFAFFYALLTPFSSSVFRTVLMILLFSLATVMNRKIHVLHGVFLSAYIMLLVDISQVTQVGFWFSYLAVIGILIFYPKGEKKIKKVPVIPRYFLNTLLVSAAATWGIMPACVSVFGTVSTGAIFLNIIMIPLVFIMLALIMGKVFFYGIPFVNVLLASLFFLVSSLFFTILNRVAPYAETLVYSVKNVPLILTAWLIGTLIFYNIPEKKVYKGWIYALLFGSVLLFPHFINDIILLSEEDNSLLIRQGKKILMMNGTKQTSFESTLLKKFRRLGISPDMLLITHINNADPENILRLKRKYKGVTVITPEVWKDISDIHLQKDTVFTWHGTHVALYPEKEKVNILLKPKETMTLGIMEYADSMEEPEIVIARKKYSKRWTGTDKFLVLHQQKSQQELRKTMKALNMEDDIKIW